MSIYIGPVENSNYTYNLLVCSSLLINHSDQRYYKTRDKHDLDLFYVI